MFTVAGATGHVGSTVASALLTRGEKVRVLVRSQAAAEPWARAGADIARVDLGDRAALAAALHGSDAFFAMLPTDPTSTDPDTDHLRLVDGIAGAVADSGTPHVVLLSSVGADLAAGTGPVRYLHHLENRLRATGTVLTALRCCHFQEKVAALLGSVRGAGVYPVFGDSPDVPLPMVATRDIGAIAAETLRSRPATSEVVDVLGPTYTEREVAEHLGRLVGTELDVVTIPRPGWTEALRQGGLSAEVAALLAELYDAGERGLLEPRAERSVTGATGIEQTLGGLVAAR